MITESSQGMASFGNFVMDQQQWVIHVVRLIVLAVLSLYLIAPLCPAESAQNSCYTSKGNFYPECVNGTAIYCSTPDHYYQEQLDALQDLLSAWASTPNMGINLQSWRVNEPYPCFRARFADNWQGVECLRLSDSQITSDCSTNNNMQFETRVLGLTLNDAQIVGKLPPAIWNFRVLTSLSLAGNKNLAGPIPVLNLTKTADALLTLDLHGNGLSGEIPADLSKFQFLTYLDLSENQFVGNISNLNFTNMLGLRTVVLSGNQLSGDIPPSHFVNLSHLSTLDLSNNRFTGGLPTLTSNRALQTVNLSKNAFTWFEDISLVIDASLSTALVTLDISETNYNNSYLSQLWSTPTLGSLRQLYLDNNSINGVLDIDKILSSDSSKQLELLSLRNNSITKVLYSSFVFPTIQIRLEGNPYCKDAQSTKDDIKRCLCGFGCSYLQDVASNAKIIIIATSVSASALVLVVIIAILSYTKIKRDLVLKLERDLQQQLQEKFQEFDVKPTIFSYEELHTATKGFNSDMKVGEGGFGAVYKGVLPNGNVVAIKQLFIKSEQGIAEFCNEVVLITEMKHRNLVKLKGCCLCETQRLLVYEYVENYDLQQALLENKYEEIISWKQRFNICIGIAQGLHYLHALAEPKIIHRDIKASNILLDINFQPKIADFGLVLLFPNEETHIMTSNVAGTKGYLAPEYATLGKVSEKLDVYSFGVVLLEIISGRKNIDNKMPPDQEYLSIWAWRLHKEEKLMDLVDRTMYLDVDEESEVQRVINIALLCLQHSHDSRPTMGEVVAMLQGDHFNLAVGELETNKSMETSLRSKLAEFSSLGSTLINSIDENESSNLFNASSSTERISSSSNSHVTLELQKIKGR